MAWAVCLCAADSHLRFEVSFFDQPRNVLIPCGNFIGWGNSLAALCAIGVICY